MTDSANVADTDSWEFEEARQEFEEAIAPPGGLRRVTDVKGLMVLGVDLDRPKTYVTVTDVRPLADGKVLLYVRGYGGTEVLVRTYARSDRVMTMHHSEIADFDPPEPRDPRDYL